MAAERGDHVVQAGRLAEHRRPTVLLLEAEQVQTVVLVVALAAEDGQSVPLALRPARHQLQQRQAHVVPDAVAVRRSVAAAVLALVLQRHVADLQPVTCAFIRTPKTK